MATGDYRSCDVCGGKAFYDANLNYQFNYKVDDVWVYSNPSFRTAGVSDNDGTILDYVGDWAVICTDCSPKFKTVIVPIE